MTASAEALEMATVAARAAAAKLAVQMGAKLGVGDAIRLDQLVGAWQKMSTDTLANIEEFLQDKAAKAKPGRGAG